MIFHMLLDLNLNFKWLGIQTESWYAISDVGNRILKVFKVCKKYKNDSQKHPNSNLKGEETILTCMKSQIWVGK